MNIQTADRLRALPPYLFTRMDQLKKEELAKGRNLISLSIGDPDLPTPPWIQNALIAAIRKPEHHQYPSHWGLLQFREAIQRWYARRFQVTLNPSDEILPLIGSKEGIGHLPFAFVNPGDEVLVPSPGYPVYAASTLLAGGTPRFFPLLEKNHFLPDLEALSKQVTPRTRLLFLNYPNNPTSACASFKFFEAVVQFAKAHGIFVCHDLAYSEIYFDKQPPVSFLSIPGAKEVGCEFHSLSKTFNMTGWRIGFVVGHAEILKGLNQIKSNLDSGLFHALQEAGAIALDEGDDFCESLRDIYQKRRNLLSQSLEEAGWSCHPGKGTFYLWAKIPKNNSSLSSEEVSILLLKNQGLLAVPGKGFGEFGEGFLRFTLCLGDLQLAEACQRIKKINLS